MVDTNYNAIGQMTSLTGQENATTTFDLYDKRGLLQETTNPLGKKRFTTYDDAGRIQSQTDRNGDVTTLSYTPTSKLKNTLIKTAAALPSITTAVITSSTWLTPAVQQPTTTTPSTA